jgi:hypothetical protein
VVNREVAEEECANTTTYIKNNKHKQSKDVSVRQHDNEGDGEGKLTDPQHTNIGTGNIWQIHTRADTT